MKSLLLALVAFFAVSGSLYWVWPPSHQDPLTREYPPYACLSIYGLETPLQNTVCSWKHPGSFYVEQAQKLGFNMIRIPVSIQYLVETDLNILDHLITACAHQNMVFCLDFHRVTNARQEESWDAGIRDYARVSSRKEMRDIMLSAITRYEHVPQFVGFNSWNEYTGTNATYKQEWDLFIFDEVERLFPSRFVYFPTGLFWGGDLIGYSLENASYADRILYSVHKYHFSGTGDRNDWDKSFGNVFPAHKLIVGEYGFRDPQDLNWGQQFVNYLVEKNIRNHCFWTVAHSGDTGGLWEDDCETLNTKKVAIIKPLLQTLT